MADGTRAAWVFTSATLSVGEDFTHFTSRLGLADAETLAIPSPFDFETQALLYLPAQLPDPAAPAHTGAVVDVAVPLIEASAGGAFVLFTSHRALQRAAQLLRDRWTELADFPLLVQGEAPREQLLRRFRESGNAVLLGTASFWEGVDVKGDALRLVIIEKLPFASPDDALTKARIEHLKANGGNAFREYQLPEAALALKQGVGRLIRSETDRGVVVICDPRLVDKPYGRVFRASLPPMPVTRVARRRRKIPAAHRRNGAPCRGAHARSRGGRNERRDRMKILALDTATEACSVSLGIGDRCIDRYVELERGHAEQLLPMVDSRAGRGRHRPALRSMPSRSDAVRAASRACGSRPASRRGSHSVRSVGVVPVSDLAAVAQRVVQLNPAVRRVLVANDARMQEVYWATFEVDGACCTSGAEHVSAPRPRCCLPRGPQCGSGLAAGRGLAAWPELARALPGGGRVSCTPTCCRAPARS